MKINFLLLIIITAGLSSCSTSYKTGQTPDDVYYSPPRLETHDVRRDREERPGDNTVYTNLEDRDTRRRIRNRKYRRYDDRYDYPYGYNNGYYGKYPNYQSGNTQNNTRPRKTNLGAYTPDKTDSTASSNFKPGKLNTGTTSPVRTFGTPASSFNNGSGIGNAIRRVFSGDSNFGNNNSNGNSSTNSNSSSRSFEPRNSNNNNSNSSNNRISPETKTTSAPVRTFKNN